MDTTHRGLEQIWDRIEAEFSKRKISARITGGMVTPRAVVFNLSKALPDNDLGDQLRKILDATEVVVMGNQITVTRQDVVKINLFTLLGKLANGYGIPPFCATLGICDDGAPLLLRLPSVDVGHVLVSGESASDLLRTIAVSLSVCNRPSAMRLVLIGQGFDDLRRLPHARGVRLSDLTPLVGRSIVAPRVVVMIDDMDKIEDGLQPILDGGHASGIHVIASRDMWHSSDGFSTIISATSATDDWCASVGDKVVRFTAATVTQAEVAQVILGALPKREPSRLRLAASLA